MSLGDYYRVKMSGNLLGQTILNIFWYQNGITDSDAEQLGETFRDTVIPYITPVVVNEYTITELEVVNQEIPGDFWVDVFSAPGLRDGECAGTFNAWGFTKNVNRPDRKPGHIRIAGVEIGAVVNGAANGFYAPRLASLANILSNTMNVGGAEFQQYIFSKRCIKGLGGRCTSEFEEDYTLVNNVTYDWYTSQNTRKPGRGI